MGRPLLIGVAAALGLLLLVQSYRLIALRLDHGEAYPQYSTFSAAPLGVRAVHDSLAALPQMDVARDLSDWPFLDPQPSQTLFILGAPYSQDPEPLVERIEAYVRAGGRLVVALGGDLPITDRLENMFSLEDDEPLFGEEGEVEGDALPEGEAEGGRTGEGEGENEGEAEGEVSAEAPRDRRQPFPTVYIDARWGAPFAGYRYEGSARATEAATRAGLPPSIPWDGLYAIPNPGPKWTVLYRITGRPAIVERTMGEGSIVLAADTKWLTNTAQREAPLGALVAWAVGPHRAVVFYEAHLGVREQAGYVRMARDYRLHLLLLGAAVVAMLYLWRSAVPLVPRRDEWARDDAALASGKDQSAALRNLLRRSVPPGDLPAACLAAWEDLNIRRAPMSAEQRERVEALAHRRRRNKPEDVVAAYNALGQELHEKERRRE